MTKPQTIDDRLERIAVAGERQADALESVYGVLKALAVPNATTRAAMSETVEEGVADAVDETPAPEETATEEPASDEPATEDGQAEEAGAEVETAAEEPADEADPLGDGDAAVDGDAIEIPEKLSTDHVRDAAREVMAKHGKPAVFEVLAKIGDGYKAVGEINSDDLEDAYVQMERKRREDPPH